MRTALVVFLNVLLHVALAGAEVLSIAPATGNTMTLYVDKTGLLSGKRHHFTFEKYEGHINMGSDTPSVTLRIAAASLVCRDTWVSQKDLAKITKAALDDMLASKQHPMILFQSRTITRTAGQYTVDGDLTIRDVAKPARIVVSREGNRFRGESVIRLKDYNLKPPSAALGAVGTRNEMQFSFDLSASPK